MYYNFPLGTIFEIPLAFIQYISKVQQEMGIIINISSDKI